MGIPQGGVLSVTLFLLEINGILGEMGNGVDGCRWSSYIYYNKKPNCGSCGTNSRKERTIICITNKKVNWENINAI